MKPITLLTLGSRGDVQPFVALGRGLQAAGYPVIIATHGPYRTFVEEYGLQFAQLPGDPRQILNQETAQLWLEAGKNPIRFFKHFVDLVEPYHHPMLTALNAVLPQTGLLIYSNLSVFGFHIGQGLDIPTICAPLQPMSRTRTFPSLIMPNLFGGHPLYNWASHVLVDWFTWQAARPFINPWRVEQFNLPPAPFWRGPYAEIYRQQEPFLYAYSSSVLPKPKDWPSWYRQTGYWFLPAPADWTPSADLLAFLADGPPPVYVGFGSMAGRKPETLTQIVLSALKQSGQRGLLLKGWGGLQQSDLPDSVFAIESAPHDWLFPQMAAVVHHGGAGTSAAGFRAGVPSIICPFFADQPFWGQRAVEIGVSPAVLPQKTLTASALAKAIHQAVGSQRIRAQAAVLGQRIRAEDGIGNAVVYIKQVYPLD